MSNRNSPDASSRKSRDQIFPRTQLPLSKILNANRLTNRKQRRARVRKSNAAASDRLGARRRFHSRRFAVVVRRAARRRATDLHGLEPRWLWFLHHRRSERSAPRSPHDLDEHFGSA